MIQLFRNDKQQIITDRNPYLCVYGILCCSKERLNVQVLFYPFEKKFNLPTLSIKFGYSECRKLEVISQKSIYGILPFRVIFIDYEPHFIRIIFRNNGAGKSYVQITDNTSLLIHFMFLGNFIFHVIFSSSYIECITLLKIVVKPIEIHITFIQKIISKLLALRGLHQVHSCH